MGMSGVAFTVFFFFRSYLQLFNTVGEFKGNRKKTINEGTHFMLSQMTVITRYLSVCVFYFFGI